MNTYPFKAKSGNAGIKPFIKDINRNDLVTGFNGIDQGNIISQSQILPEPQNTDSLFQNRVI